MKLLRLLAFCLALAAWTDQSAAMDSGGKHPPAPGRIQAMRPALPDEDTLELFVAAVADLHRTSLRLGKRLGRLEAGLTRLKQQNDRLRQENARLRKTLRLQAAVPSGDWYSTPLDKEVRDANRMLESLLGGIAGLGRR